MYANAQSRVRVGEGFSKEFEVKVGVHQGSILSPSLFIIVLEALSREFRAGVPWEDLYADDLVIIAGPLAKFRGIPMRCVPYRSRQQQHLLQWLQTLGT